MTQEIIVICSDSEKEMEAEPKQSDKELLHFRILKNSSKYNTEEIKFAENKVNE